jgi:hypothetical protein
MVAHSFLNRMVAQNALATRRHSSAGAAGTTRTQVDFPMQTSKSVNYFIPLGVNQGFVVN